jgi:ABC-type uncharacterized transport system substrate-binding protein
MRWQAGPASGAVAILVILAAFAARAVAQGPPTGGVQRLGFLNSGDPERESFLWEPLRESLRRRGWIEGQTIVFERRSAEGDYERLPELAAELIRLPSHVLVAVGGPAATAARDKTATIPIVMWGAGDPVGTGLAASLAQPGGNVTGLSDDQSPDVIGKRLQLLKAVAPGISRLSVFTRARLSPIVHHLTGYQSAYDAASRTLALPLRFWTLQTPDDIDRVFAQVVATGGSGVDVPNVPATWIHRQRIVDLAARYRLPAVYWHRQFVVDGGLMAYGVDEREVPARLADFIDKILRGARPADLPVEQPTRFELVINRGTAKALGLEIPPAVLALVSEQVP